MDSISPAKERRYKALISDIIDKAEDDMEYYVGHEREMLEESLLELFVEQEVRV